MPVIENIHQKLLEAVTADGCKLEMERWHTCNTTHCFAGWTVFLAGKEGNDLERKTSTPFAAQQIIKASSSIEVAPTRFYESNKVAMDGIKKRAEQEKQLEQK